MKRLLKIDMNNSKSTKDPSGAQNMRRKQLVNLRDNLAINKNTTNENIPRKLLIELASLSNMKYKIEVKSKYQSVVLPLNFNKQKQSKLKQINNNYESGKDLAIKDESQSQIDFNTSGSNKLKPSPLENDYVTLKCLIINKSLVLVPPIHIFVPYNYPESNPFVDCEQLDEFDDDMLPEYSIQ